MYSSFTNCPLNNPLMHESGQISATNSTGFAACVAGLATGGSIKIGNLTTTVTQRVNVQFGFAWTAGITNYPLPAYPPLAGTSAILSTKPDLIPGSLTTALGCSTATDPTILKMCQTAQAKGGVYNQVFALAQEAGNLSNFNLLSWTQPVKFQLVNPLLGNNCYIGTDSNPVVLNPSLSVLPGGKFFIKQDPVPSVHPDTFVLGIKGAAATDTTFSAPVVIGCGPGGVADVNVDLALDAFAGLPSASGNNTLSLTGNFLIAANTAAGDSSLTQPQDSAADLLAAFKASTNGEHSIEHIIDQAQFQTALHNG